MKNFWKKPMYVCMNVVLSIFVLFMFLLVFIFYVFVLTYYWFMLYSTNDKDFYTSKFNGVFDKLKM